jgi:tRNA threonylcarbamoyladenosine biosynthesis protein TsaB
MPAAKLLAIEMSGRSGSVAVAVAGRVAERTIATPREQTQRVLALVDALLAETALGLVNLDALVLGRGPGSFTGLRVAAAVVQGLSLAAGLPIVSVSSLAALAQRGLTGRAGLRALCCVDARMGEVFTGGYRLEAGLAVLERAESIGRPEAVRGLPGRYLAFGDGFAAYADALALPIGAALEVDPALAPRARDLLPLAAAEIAAGRFVAREAALPCYLREAEAWL